MSKKILELKNVNKYFITSDGKTLKACNNINLDIGCIIFENADKYFSSKYDAEFFVKWLNENVNSDINVIFHFSYPIMPHHA